MTILGLIGVPSQGAGRSSGTARGVGALRAAWLVDALANQLEVDDLGDVPVPRARGHRDPTTSLIDPPGLAALVRAVDSSVTAALGAGRFPLVLGGDCPMLLGCARAARRHVGAVGLLHVDAHEDHYLPTESPTGAWSDCEIAFTLGTAPFSWDAELASEQPFVDPSGLAILGARDGHELARHGVESLRDTVLLLDAGTTSDDAAGATARGLEVVAAPGFWLHLDWDVLDTRVMPAVICPIDGGLDWHQLDVIMTAALAHPGCLGVSAGTYNPDLDHDGSVAERIVRHLVGWLAAR